MFSSILGVDWAFKQKIVFFIKPIYFCGQFNLKTLLRNKGCELTICQNLGILRNIDIDSPQPQWFYRSIIWIIIVTVLDSNMKDDKREDEPIVISCCDAYEPQRWPVPYIFLKMKQWHLFSGGRQQPFHWN